VGKEGVSSEGGGGGGGGGKVLFKGKSFVEVKGRQFVGKGGKELSIYDAGERRWGGGEKRGNSRTLVCSLFLFQEKRKRGELETVLEGKGQSVLCSQRPGGEKGGGNKKSMRKLSEKCPAEKSLKGPPDKGRRGIFLEKKKKSGL